MNTNGKAPVRSRVSKDRRQLSRTIALLDCHFVYREATHQAVIIDVSLQGALLSAKVLPPVGSAITVLVESAKLKKPLALAAAVVRDGGTGITVQHAAARFGVRFHSLSLELFTLLQTPKGM